ncbi:hypothetical protein [Domibacillus tundrae]|uniref:hypothetical protein n=1 Tax=Domibacillus tundrae TaxID=1587527 RepID=UPI00061829FE|nr:hypothetical protein [Domibacillus tundrae]
MTKIYTLEEAVYGFGDEKKIASFEKSKTESKKGEGNLNKRSIDSLVKDIECYFESVTVEGKGAKRKFICEGKKEFATAKEDNRKNNGRDLPYEYEINSMVIDYILKNKPIKPMSLNHWIVELGLGSKTFTTSYYIDVIKDRLFDELKEKYKGLINDKDYIMLEHAIKTELNTMKNNLRSTFNKLAKAKIIMHKIEWYGCIDDSGHHRPLTDEEFTAIGELKRYMLIMNNISASDLWKRNDKNVKKYWESYSERLKKDFGFRYIYEAHGAVLCVTDKDIERYLERLKKKGELNFTYGLNEEGLLKMLIGFYSSYGNSAMTRAKSREEKVKEEDLSYLGELKRNGQYVNKYEKMLEALKIR